MRTWQRSSRRLNCGHCRAEIHIGDPLFIIRHDVEGWRKFRCATCAGEPVPAELPALQEQASQPARLRPLRELAEDWKVKASGG